MYLIELGMMRVFIKVLTVPLNILFPVILLMCVVGTITVNNRIFDSWVLLAVGIMGYFLANNNFPLAPVVLGFILGGIIENNLRTALLASQGNVLDVAGRPIALGLLIFGALMVIIPEILARRTRKRIAAAKALEEENLNEENQSE
jgi:putative tricarboxylic transport membrane protein